MSMSGSSFDGDDDLVTDINMTPLIDVMLVLLIIFIITLPVITRAVKVDLPRGDTPNAVQQDVAVDISISADGTILWNKEPLDDQQLQQKVAESAVLVPVPTLRVYADKEVRYDRVAHLLTAAQGGGLSKIDFVTKATTP
ncbi:biopolymer transport protein ExbD [Pseudomonas sp. JAI111]|uniref:ExbD/TolR family protein n=1 Tax=Pseudomonas sp. JAI111 TaxID=2735913 RepID=UPI00216A6E68|nr:biopolymer transporter ExbD [Pseudomonas sp. JAI111]MCS3835729.1 biopolymer transport protein ExbD [Pseudomonas sp. JAI111]